MKQKISTSNAPAAIGPYSQAVRAGDTLYISGQIPLCPATGKIVGETTPEQAEQVFKNLSAILKEAGMTFDNVVKATVLLTDIADFAAVNEVYARYLNGETLPARAAFAVKALPAGLPSVFSWGRFDSRTFRCYNNPAQSPKAKEAGGNPAQDRCRVQQKSTAPASPQDAGQPLEVPPRRRRRTGCEPKDLPSPGRDAARSGAG